MGQLSEVWGLDEAIRNYAPCVAVHEIKVHQEQGITALGKPDITMLCQHKPKCESENL
jgi:hypothetical protein